MAPTHVKSNLTFRRTGRTFQYRIESAEDLLGILEVDEAHWVAVSAPVTAFSCDPELLRHLDRDRDERIRCDDLQEAVRWLFGILRDAAGVSACSDTLRIDALNPDVPDGASIATAARRMLDRLGLAGGDAVSLAQVREMRTGAEKAAVSEAGVVLPAAAGDTRIGQFLTDVIAATGGAPHPTGARGVGTAQLDQFLKEAGAYLQWHACRHPTDGGDAGPLLPLGEETDAAYAVLARVRDAVEWHFARCRAAVCDGRLAQDSWGGPADVSAWRVADPAALEQRLGEASIAPVTTERLLRFDGPVNPHYEQPVARFHDCVLKPLLSPDADTMSEEQWGQVKAAFAGYEAWLKSKPVSQVEQFGVDKLREYADETYAQAVRTLVAKSLETSLALESIRLIERAILFQRYLIPFANNYVSFPTLFDSRRALFEMGTMVLEGKEFNFSVQVDSRAYHANLAKNSGIFLLYLQVTGPQPADNFEVAVPVTRGNPDGLYVGRRGVFFTVAGRELDAQIVLVVDNPVSFWHQMKAPLRFVRGLISKRFDQMSTGLQKEVETSVGKAGAQIEGSLQAGMREAPGVAAETAALGAPREPIATAPPPVRQESGRTAGNTRDLMIGVGFLIAGLGTALKFLADAAKQLTNPQTLHVIAIIVAVFAAVIVLITAISAWSKLRRRDLGGLLQASGWAINGRLRLTRPMARLFTRRTPLPRESEKRRWLDLRRIKRLPRPQGKVRNLLRIG